MVPSVMSSCPVGTTGTLVAVVVLSRLVDVLVLLLLLDMLVLLLLLLLNEIEKMAGGYFLGI